MKGAREEALARTFLERRGLTAVTCNYRCRGGELDLVMREGDTVVIVEVRKRSRPEFGTPEESVTAKKRARIVLATRSLLARRHDLADSPVRFDVIAVDGADNMRWTQAAFDAEG